MSKMGQDFLEMQTDAVNLSREDFVKKYGAVNADLYEQINTDAESDWVYPGQDCQT